MHLLFSGTDKVQDTVFQRTDPERVQCMCRCIRLHKIVRF